MPAFNPNLGSLSSTGWKTGVVFSAYEWCSLGGKMSVVFSAYEWCSLGNAIQ